MVVMMADVNERAPPTSSLAFCLQPHAFAPCICSPSYSLLDFAQINWFSSAPMSCIDALSGHSRMVNVGNRPCIDEKPVEMSFVGPLRGGDVPGVVCVSTVMTRSTPVPTPSLHPLGPGPIPDVSSRTRSASRHIT